MVKMHVVCRLSNTLLSLRRLIGHVTLASISTDSSSRILGRSMVFHQDGLVIKELPLIIRKLDALDLPYFTSMYTGESLQKISYEDEMFKHQLMECRSIAQVLHLLEVPGNEVTAYSAAFALQRLCALEQGSAEHIQSFVQRAILHELCETVAGDICELSGDTVITLLRCSLLTHEYDYKFRHLLREEIERRVGHAALSIPQLCSTLDILYSFSNSDKQLAENVWIHLGSRFLEFDELVLPDVYRTIQHLPARLRYIWHLIDRQMVSVFWKLSSEDISLIITRMSDHKHKSPRVMTCIGRWLQMNIHTATDTVLRDVMYGFNHLNGRLNPQEISAIERYVVAKITNMDRGLVALIMEHLRINELVSTKIFDSVAMDFEENAACYGVEEILHVIRPYGQLIYSPQNASQLYQTVEDVVTRKLCDFHPAALTELLASCVYVQRLPINFFQRLFTVSFRQQVHSVEDDDRRYCTLLALMQIQAAIIIDYPHHYTNRFSYTTLGLPVNWLTKTDARFHSWLYKLLEMIVGKKYFHTNVVPKYTPHNIDFVINVQSRRVCLSNHGNLMPAENGFKRCLALVLMLPEYYCNITQDDRQTIVKHHDPSLLKGSIRMKIRHLHKLGYTVIPVSYKIYETSRRHPHLTEQSIINLLEPYIDFDDKPHFPAN